MKVAVDDLRYNRTASQMVGGLMKSTLCIPVSHCRARPVLCGALV
jgi:hypothetical protein